MSYISFKEIDGLARIKGKTVQTGKQDKLLTSREFYLGLEKYLIEKGVTERKGGIWLDDAREVLPSAFWCSGAKGGSKGAQEYIEDDCEGDDCPTYFDTLELANNIFFNYCGKDGKLSQAEYYSMLEDGECEG